MFYLPGTRHSSVLQKKLRVGMREGDKIKALMDLRDSTTAAVSSLRTGNWERLGNLLDHAWEQKKRSNPAVTNTLIDRIYKIAKQSGALGGKVMGAGGAGHLFFLVPPSFQEIVRMNLLSEGVEVVPFNFDFDGLVVKTYRHTRVVRRHHVVVREGFLPRTRVPAAFLDRDGTINVEKHLGYRMDEFELIPGVAEAIRLLNERGIPVVVYHNAAVVARGLCSEEQVIKLHRKMKRLLAKEGAYVDVIVFCPHHPQGIDPGYAYDCDWRKPKTGMLRFVSERFQFDLRTSFVVGDTSRDIIMGKAVGARTILVQTGHAGKDNLYRDKPEWTVKDLPAAVERILQD